MSEPEILVRRVGRLGHVTLNRPRALHALTRAMCETFTRALLSFRDDPAIELVLVDHAGERGFCAGGDIRVLTDSLRTGGVEARAFFRAEYQLDHLLFTFPKPVVALMDGVVMGGGAGISLPCRYRIASERTAFAMPETGIGLFPDVGGSYYLSRLPSHSGRWLALTGARIGAADCMLLGLSTHFVPHAQLQALREALANAPEEVEGAIRALETDAGSAPLALLLDTIDTTFCADTVEGVLTALAAHGTAWAHAQRDEIAKRSPLSSKIAVRLLALGATLTDFAEVMELEYRIATRLVARPDFAEGVRAIIVDRDNAPRWQPATLADCTQAMVDAIFAPLPDDARWRPLG